MLLKISLREITDSKPETFPHTQTQDQELCKPEREPHE